MSCVTSRQNYSKAYCDGVQYAIKMRDRLVPRADSDEPFHNPYDDNTTDNDEFSEGYRDGQYIALFHQLR